MSERDKDWNPEDGPRPGEDEIADARALAGLLADPAAARKKPPVDPDVHALASVALRVRATAHPDRDRAKLVTAAAVQHAVENAGARWYKSRWGWAAAAAAALVVGVGGAQYAFSPPAAGETSSITRPGGDAFDTSVRRDARSEPISRIYDSRMSLYREVILHGSPAPRRSP